MPQGRIFFFTYRLSKNDVFFGCKQTFGLRDLREKITDADPTRKNKPDPVRQKKDPDPTQFLHKKSPFPFFFRNKSI